MAPRRHKPAATATDSSGSQADDAEQNSGGLSYGLDEDAYGNVGTQADTDGEHDAGNSAVDEYDDDDAETGDDADGGQDADDEYDDAEEYADDEYDEDAAPDAGDNADDAGDQPFTPPTAMSAMRNAFRTPRQKAQPATGTEVDAQRVNFLNPRERIIGYVFSVMMAALAVVLFFHYRDFIDTKDLTLQGEYHHDAPWVLVITLGLGLMIAAATYFKRRAALGFTLLLAGVANFGVIPEVGLVYLGTGLWLVFRSMKRNPRAAAGRRAGAARAGTTTRGGASTRAASTTRSTGSTTTSGGRSSRAGASSTATRSSGAATGRTIGKNGRIANAPTSGRYTPPKPTRHAPPAVQPEPEPSNRLSSWLKK